MAQRLRCNLPATFPALEPSGIVVERWRSSASRDVHALLEAAYAEGAGTVPPFAAWGREFERDEDFDADSCFLALRGEALAGVALCWSSAFLKDLAVAAPERARGLGTYLLRRVCDHFTARGAPAVDLKVKVHNEAAARLYRRLGFEPVGAPE